MGMRIALEFYIDEVLCVGDLDDLSDVLRAAIDEKIGETDYMVQDIHLDFETDI